MAPDAVMLMRLGSRGSPSWRGLCPQTGYVGADCRSRSLKPLADGAGHTFFEQAQLESLLGDDFFELLGLAAESLDLVAGYRVVTRLLLPAEKMTVAGTNSPCRAYDPNVRLRE